MAASQDQATASMPVAMSLEGAAIVSPSRPALLPAFEPLTSSPVGLPRITKRKFDQTIDERAYLPTPVPTSSTGILPSSPPRPRTRPPLQRSVSTLSERAPLGDVPSLDLPYNGEPMLMGRSSNSSDYQLSANRHISRVHIRAQYFAPDSSHEAGKVEVECLGWNGAKVHCKGEVKELSKGGIFLSDKPLTQIIVDVQDTRVMLVWPKEARDIASIATTDVATTWCSASSSPVKRRMLSHGDLASSPPSITVEPQQRTPLSPVAPLNVISTFTSTFRADQSPVQIYEDSEEDAPHENTTPVPVHVSQRTITGLSSTDLFRSLASAEDEDLSEHDEENDPIIHSFGPFGENLLSKLESFQSTSPQHKRKPLTASPNSLGRAYSASSFRPSPIKNHVINQLAFSRVHSLPLSTIHTNLPAELRGAMVKPSDTENAEVLTTSGLKTLLDDIPCVGEISREGKDAAGKLLESEFYYIPERDNDVMRRETVTLSLGKTSIRAARKQHKQYYWKRPRH